MKGDASIDRDSLECSDAARSSLESTATSSEEADQLNGNTARESSISGYSSERRESNSSSSSENKPKDVHRSNDPLRWFGVLVSNQYDNYYTRHKISCFILGHHSDNVNEDY